VIRIFVPIEGNCELKLIVQDPAAQNGSFAGILNSMKSVSVVVFASVIAPRKEHPEEELRHAFVTIVSLVVLTVIVAASASFGRNQTQDKTIRKLSNAVGRTVLKVPRQPWRRRRSFVLARAASIDRLRSRLAGTSRLEKLIVVRCSFTGVSDSGSTDGAN
jgi:hypothetical protein